MSCVSLLDGYLTREELADQLGKSVRTLDRWYMWREGPNPTFIGNRRLYHVDDVASWLRAQRRELVPPKAE